MIYINIQYIYIHIILSHDHHINIAPFSSGYPRSSRMHDFASACLMEPNEVGAVEPRTINTSSPGMSLDIGVCSIHIHSYIHILYIVCKLYIYIVYNIHILHVFCILSLYIKLTYDILLHTYIYTYIYIQ